MIYYSQPIFIMIRINLRKIKPSDKKRYFARWWRDKGLLKLTSGGILKMISDKEIDKYFQAMLNSKDTYNFIIIADGKIIGHISLAKKKKRLARNADRDWG